jgi:hypothetical protein
MHTTRTESELDSSLAGVAGPAEASVEPSPEDIELVLASVGEEEAPEVPIQRLVELLRPAINRIARRIYEENGYVVSEDYDFFEARHPQEMAILRGAVGAIEVLEEFLIDGYGASLLDLCDPGQE